MIPICSQVWELWIQNHLLRGPLWVSLWDRIMIYFAFLCVFNFNMWIIWVMIMVWSVLVCGMRSLTPFSWCLTADSFKPHPSFPWGPISDQADKETWVALLRHRWGIQTMKASSRTWTTTPALSRKDAKLPGQSPFFGFSSHFRPAGETALYSPEASIM